MVIISDLFVRSFLLASTTNLPTVVVAFGPLWIRQIVSAMVLMKVDPGS